MTKIIDGKILADKILEELRQSILESQSRGAVAPKLAIILASPSPASKIYVNNKIKAAGNIGVEPILIEYPESCTEIEIISKIQELNNDPSISGIIAQLPLYNHLSSVNIIDQIDPRKDVDGLHHVNIGLLYSGRKPFFAPCTPAGIIELIKDELGPLPRDLAGKSVVIVGRSNIVGKPLASLLLQHDMTVTICHSKSEDIKSIMKNADIVVTASGQMLMFGRDYFSPKTIIIDVGINKTPEGRVVGDVIFDEVKDYVRAVTKVPGGVGPMTIASLLRNVVSSPRN